MNTCFLSRTLLLSASLLLFAACSDDDDLASLSGPAADHRPFGTVTNAGQTTQTGQSPVIEGAETGQGGPAEDMNPGSGASQSPATGIDSSLVGLWDFTTIEDGLEDVYYLEITAEGRWTEWDFDGDEFDAGENCYFRYDATITSRGDGTYEIAFFEETETETLSVTSSSNGLTLSNGVDSLTLPRITMFTSAEFNPC